MHRPYSLVTVTVQLADRVPAVAVIIVMPADRPVTTPPATVATRPLLDAHTTAAPLGVVVAVSVVVLPAATVAVDGETLRAVIVDAARAAIVSGV